jgi:hypothetical protein
MHRSTTPFPLAQTACGDEAIDRLLHPSRFYQRPRDVLDDVSLSRGEKRAILSSWASDACAVASCPQLRYPAYAAEPVLFDDVMDVLMALDRDDGRSDENPRRLRGSENLPA